MAWRETERAAAAMIRRTYRCTDCGTEFRVMLASEDEAPGACPRCPPTTEPSAPAVWVPPRPGIVGIKSKAIDYTQNMMEQDYGLTDFNDNMRVGDMAIKSITPSQTGEREKVIRELVEAGMPIPVAKEVEDAASNYWQGQAGGSVAENSTMVNNSVASAASAAARAEGAEPLSILERARDQGIMRPKYNVVAAVPMDE